MNIHWFQNPDNVVYVKEDDFVSNFSKELGIGHLKEEITKLREHPAAEGVTLKGLRRSSVKLFIPDLTFHQHLELGENVWAYLGPNYPCYALFIPWEEDVQSEEDKNQ